MRERAEKKIVVVAHGDILRQLTDGRRSTTVRLPLPSFPYLFPPFFVCYKYHDADVSRRLSKQPWANAEVRSFRFRFADDDDALLEEIKEEAKEGTEEPTSGEMK